MTNHVTISIAFAGTSPYTKTFIKENLPSDMQAWLYQRMIRDDFSLDICQIVEKLYAMLDTCSCLIAELPGNVPVKIQVRGHTT